MSIFLSYAYRDNDVIQKVRKHLVDNQMDVFDDRNDIAAGASLIRSINQAIDRSDTLLFFVSSNSEKSIWMSQEISFAIDKKMKGGEATLIPVLLEKNAKIPFFLKDYLYIDLTEESNFDISMDKLVKSLKVKPTATYEDELQAKHQSIELEIKNLANKNLEYESLKKSDHNKIMYTLIFSTLFTAVAISVVFLAWLVKDDIPHLQSLISGALGAACAAISMLIFHRESGSKKKKLLKKIEDLEIALKQKEANNDN